MEANMDSRTFQDTALRIIDQKALPGDYDAITATLQDTALAEALRAELGPETFNMWNQAIAVAVAADLFSGMLQIKGDDGLTADEFNAKLGCGDCPACKATKARREARAQHVLEKSN